MYPNLSAELVRHRVTQNDIAKLLGISISTMSCKMTGKSGFTLDEAMNIHEFLNADITLTELFEREG